MSKKKIKRLIKKMMGTIAKLSGAIGNGFDQDTIHDFRVSVKSLRSILRLMESCAEDDKFRMPKKLKRLYGIAGIIRESQLEKNMLYKKRVDAPKYVDALMHNIKEQKNAWYKHYSKKTIRKVLKRITTYRYKPLNPEAVNVFYHTRIASFKDLAPLPTDTQLHQVRKDLKDILLIENFLPSELKRAVQFPNKNLLGKLEELAQTIGSYNDERLMLQHVNKFLDRTGKSNAGTFSQA